MNGSEIESAIYGWFNKQYPHSPQWTTREFDCFRDVPLELRAVIFMGTVEGEIANGGLPQLLWNTFYHWQKLFQDAEKGYELMGASLQAKAIRGFAALFKQYESECGEYVARCVRENDFKYFSKWCAAARDRLKSDREKLFYTDAGVYEERMEWLVKNEERLIQLME